MLKPLLTVLRYGSVYTHGRSDPDCRRLIRAMIFDRFETAKSILGGALSPNDRSWLISTACEECGSPPDTIGWGTKHPNDALAQTITGVLAVDWAWKARSGAPSSMVKNEQWVGFHDRLRIAEGYLKKAIALNPSDPEPYVSLMHISVGRSDGLDRTTGYFERAVAICPDHVGAHNAMLMQSTNKWGGSDQDMRSFVSRTVARAPAGHPLHWLVCKLLREEYIAKLFQDDHARVETVLNDQRFRTAVARAQDACTRQPNHTLGKREVLIRSEFAAYCYWTGLPDRAREELAILGKRVEGKSFELAGVYPPKYIAQVRRQVGV